MRIFFSIERAESLLPKLIRLLRQIRGEVALYHRWERDYIDNLREVIDEIESVGGILRDPKTGVIDFPAIRLGEPVYLCWRLGERRISYWHRIDEECSKRKIINPEEFYREEELTKYIVREREAIHEKEEYPDKIIVTIDLRGVAEKDIDVKLDGDNLKITWKNDEGRKTKLVTLNKRLKNPSIRSEYRNGILTITIRKEPP